MMTVNDGSTVIDVPLSVQCGLFAGSVIFEMFHDLSLSFQIPGPGVMTIDSMTLAKKIKLEGMLSTMGW